MLEQPVGDDRKQDIGYQPIQRMPKVEGHTYVGLELKGGKHLR